MVNGNDQNILLSGAAALFIACYCYQNLDSCTLNKHCLNVNKVYRITSDGDSNASNQADYALIHLKNGKNETLVWAKMKTGDDYKKIDTIEHISSNHNVTVEKCTNTSYVEVACNQPGKIKIQDNGGAVDDCLFTSNSSQTTLAAVCEANDIIQDLDDNKLSDSSLPIGDSGKNYESSETVKEFVVKWRDDKLCS